MSESLLDEFREQKSFFGVNTEIDNKDIEFDDLKECRSLFDPKSDGGHDQGEAEMQTLGLCGDTQQERTVGFWRRQFQNELTRRQKQYDWAFGAIMPAVCFFFDPIIFKFWDGDSGGLFGVVKPAAYAGSFISILLMMAWLLWRERLGGFSALLAGVFFAAGAVALTIGVVLLPFSILGIFFYLIGILGFTPLLTGVIFLRNGVRALRAAKPNLPKSKLAYASVVGTLWGLAIPFVLQMEVIHSLDLISNGTTETIRVQGWKLRLLAPIVDGYQLQKIIWDKQQSSPERKEIENLYIELTGHNPQSERGWD